MGKVSRVPIIVLVIRPDINRSIFVDFISKKKLYLSRHKRMPPVKALENNIIKNTKTTRVKFKLLNLFIIISHRFFFILSQNPVDHLRSTGYIYTNFTAL